MEGDHVIEACRPGAWPQTMEEQLAAERAQAVALVGSLHQQLTYQLACRQEKCYQEGVAGKVEEGESFCQPAQDLPRSEYQADEATIPRHRSLAIGDLTASHVEDDVPSPSPPVSPCSSVSHTPYVTPPDSPTMLRQRFFLPLPSLSVTIGTQTDESPPHESSLAVPETETSLSELSETGVNTDPLPSTLEAATNTTAVCVEENSVNTELSVFELLKLVHEAENTHRLQERHNSVMKELNEETSKRMVSEHLVQIVQSDLMEVRQHSITETTARLRLENEVADLKVRDQL